MDTLKQEVERYNAKGDILVGDLNSRTGLMQEDTLQTHEITNESIRIENEHQIPPRQNEDHAVNQYGKALLGIMNNAHLIIVNGRVLGDTKGAKTCYKYNGSSTVDYVIVSTDLWNNVLTFRILDWICQDSYNPMNFRDI